MTSTSDYRNLETDCGRDETFRAFLPFQIFQNSCVKCKFKDRLVDGKYPWLSTCHAFQCEKCNINLPAEDDEVANINQDEDNGLIEIESPVSSDVHIDELPPELLSKVFDFLDGYSLYCAGNVSTRWRNLLQSTTKNHQKKFEMAFDELWPHQFRDLYTLMDYQTFSSLFESVNCNQCFLMERVASPIDTRVEGWLVRRMNTEIQTLPCEGVQAIPFQNNDRIDEWMARIEGPKFSSYENGIFYLIMKFPGNYPVRPPKIRFLTKVFHPAVSCHGHISLDLLGPQWSPTLTIRTILLSIQSLLTDKDLELCENTAIGNLWKENKPEYERLARIWNEKYAMQHLIHAPSSSTTHIRLE